MIGFMPEIYPDELIYSWFCRYLVHSGYSANKMALNDLLFNKQSEQRVYRASESRDGADYQ